MTSPITRRDAASTAVFYHSFLLVLVGHWTRFRARILGTSLSAFPIAGYAIELVCTHKSFGQETQQSCVRAFSLAQAFTPGERMPSVFSSFSFEPPSGGSDGLAGETWCQIAPRRPLKGTERKRKTRCSLPSPGVNAWASEKAQNGEPHALINLYATTTATPYALTNSDPSEQFWRRQKISPRPPCRNSPRPFHFRSR